MNPNYVATKSVAVEVTFLRVLACILIIPIFYLVYKCLEVKSYRIEFYDDKIVTYRGLISKSKRQSVFMGVASTAVTQSLKGRIFNYGSISVDCVGKWDIDTTAIKNPYALEEYLQTRIMSTTSSTPIIHV